MKRVFANVALIVFGIWAQQQTDADWIWWGKFCIGFGAMKLGLIAAGWK